jgi:Na+/H+ antiporter NhaA
VRPRDGRSAPLRAFLLTESGSAGVLVAAVGLALPWANLAQASYEAFRCTDLSVRLGTHALEDDLRGWVDDGLMTLFFLVVGLEARREFDRPPRATTVRSAPHCGDLRDGRPGQGAPLCG